MADQSKLGDKSTSEGANAQSSQEPQADNRPEAREERYTAAAWKERARERFDTSPHEIAGALHDTGDSELAENQVKKRLAEYREREHEVEA